MSYLAISQYFAAVQHPPHLAADLHLGRGSTMCTGISCIRAAFARMGSPGSGFTKPGRLASRPVSKLRRTGIPIATSFGQSVRRLSKRSRRPSWFAQVFRITHCTRAAVSRPIGERFPGRNGFTRIAPANGARITVKDATEIRLRFFDHFLKGDDNGWDREPAVRLAIYDTGSKPATVTSEEAWPPNDLTWQRLWLGAKRHGPGGSPRRAGSREL